LGGIAVITRSFARIVSIRNICNTALLTRHSTRPT
jgi:hypothetical protein